jgi:alpha-tubulin suppressor-like RCC1 family protein
LVDAGRGPAILLPDGRLWIGNGSLFSQNSLSGAFAPGTNWVCLDARNGDADAIKADGTLWNVSDAPNLSQIGSDSDWKKVAAAWPMHFGLKRDGTVWEWGSLESRVGHPIIEIPEPVRIGTNSDWMDIFAQQPGNYLNAVKNDGTVYGLAADRHFNPPISHSAFRPTDTGLAGTNWAAYEGAPVLLMDFALGLRKDGTLWAGGSGLPPLFGNELPHAYRKTAVRVGDKSDWAQLSLTYFVCVALESNGVVYAMRCGDFQTGHPSRQTDWIGAAAVRNNYIWALAADGTLCCWEEDFDDYHHLMRARHWLRATRRPVAVFNILDSK